MKMPVCLDKHLTNHYLNTITMNAKKDSKISFDQRRYRNEFHKGVVNLMHTSGWLNNQLKDFFQKYDLTYQQYNVLKIIREAKNGTSVNAVKNLMLDKMSDVSRIVERLRKKEFITRIYSTQDRRSVQIFITQAGIEMLEEIESDHDFMDSMLARLDQNEISMLNSILSKVRTEKERVN